MSDCIFIVYTSFDCQNYSNVVWMRRNLESYKSYLAYWLRSNTGIISRDPLASRMMKASIFLQLSFLHELLCLRSTHQCTSSTKRWAISWALGQFDDVTKNCDDPHTRYFLCIVDNSLSAQSSQHGILSGNPMGCGNIRDGACAVTSGIVSLALLSSIRFSLKSILELCPGQVRRFFTWIRTHIMEDPMQLLAFKRHRNG